MAREPLPQVLSLLSASNKSSSPKVRSKAAYCLSAALKHNTDAVRQMDTRGGWDILRDALQGTNLQCSLSYDGLTPRNEIQTLPFDRRPRFF
jgi:hypothetical protein